MTLFMDRVHWHARPALQVKEPVPAGALLSTAPPAFEAPAAPPAAAPQRPPPSEPSQLGEATRQPSRAASLTRASGSPGAQPHPSLSASPSQQSVLAVALAVPAPVAPPGSPRVDPAPQPLAAAPLLQQPPSPSLADLGELVSRSVNGAVQELRWVGPLLAVGAACTLGTCTMQSAPSSTSLAELLLDVSLRSGDIQRMETTWATRWAQQGAASAELTARVAAGGAAVRA